jgi:hypothetical protein
MLRFGSLGEKFGIRSRNFKGQSQDLTGRLPVVVKDQQVARFIGRLLLNAECTVPVDGVIQQFDDLRSGHGCGQCGRDPRGLGRDWGRRRHAGRLSCQRCRSAQYEQQRRGYP